MAFDLPSYLLGTENGGGGNPLPTPTADGVVLVGVNGQWKQVEGYGYESVEMIAWDGDTTDRPSIDDAMYKVSDNYYTKEQLESATYKYVKNGVEAESALEQVAEESGVRGVVTEDGLVLYCVFDPEIGYETGTYFYRIDENTYLSKMEFSSVTPISQSLVFTKAEADGTALVYVNGEWVQQSGYGYEGEGLTIEWDGDTTGRETFTIASAYSLYKVSDTVLTYDMASGGKLTESGVFGGEPREVEAEIGGDDLPIEDVGGALAIGQYYCWSGAAGEYEYSGFSVSIPEDGTYVHSQYVDEENYVYISKLTAPSSVTPIDPKYIPSDYPTETTVASMIEEAIGGAVDDSY